MHDAYLYFDTNDKKQICSGKITGNPFSARNTAHIRSAISGDIESIVLKKAGLDDWLCDYVSITDSSTGKSWQFNFAGEKIGKYGTAGKLHFAS